MTATPRPWPAATPPTPEQLAEWLTYCTPEERVDFARHAIAHGRTASDCFARDHEGRIEMLQHGQSCMQEDLREILQALGLFDGARSTSPHDVVVQEILPEIRRRLDPNRPVKI